MVETLEHFIRQANVCPRASRRRLYKELLRSDTYLLNIGEPVEGERVLRLSHRADPVSVWADRDPELGGVWVPVFPARDTVSRFVTIRELTCPEGREFLWMALGPRKVFPLLLGVDCFAGIHLYLDDSRRVAIPWGDVKALSEGRLPDESPAVFEAPVAKLPIPPGTRVAFGRLAGSEARLLCVPQAGHFRPEDMRRMVRVQVPGGAALTPCRHFLQLLRLVKGGAGGDSGRYYEDLLRALVAFEMYGEAESLCHWLAKKQNEAYAWVFLSAVYGRTGRFDECADICRRGAEKYPDEKAFPINGAKALITLGRRDEAARFLAPARERFPDDVQIQALLRCPEPKSSQA